MSKDHKTGSRWVTPHGEFYLIDNALHPADEAAASYKESLTPEKWQQFQMSSIVAITKLPFPPAGLIMSEQPNTEPAPAAQPSPAEVAVQQMEQITADLVKIASSHFKRAEKNSSFEILGAENKALRFNVETAKQLQTILTNTMEMKAALAELAMLRRNLNRIPTTIS